MMKYFFGTKSNSDAEQIPDHIGEAPAAAPAFEIVPGSPLSKLDAAEAQAELQAKLEQILGAERTQSEYDAAQATLSNAYCNEALECRFWEEAQGAWVSDGSCRTVPLTGSDGGVRCECDHLTDFVVVKVYPCPTTSSPPAAHRRCVSVQVPSNWDELAASVLLF